MLGLDLGHTLTSKSHPLGCGGSAGGIGDLVEVAHSLPGAMD
jgi:hypothetical protein